MTEDDLKSINDFDKYTKFIQKFILQNTTLWKLIFYPYSSPLSDPRAIDSENPYEIFSREVGSDGKILDSHGVILFDDKDDSIQNSSNVTVLVSYESTRFGNSYFLDNNYIIFQIICKGSGVRKLANGKDRAEIIGNMIDDEFNLARINDIGEVHKISFEKLKNINEENIGRVLTYKCKGIGSKVLTNVNYNRRKYGVDKLP